MSAVGENAGPCLLPVMVAAPVALLCACLDAFCAQVKVVGVLLPPAKALPEDDLARLVATVKRHSAAVLVREDATSCRRLGADGVQLCGNDPARVKAIRRALGREFIIGACCPTGRHAAMELGEAGADYLVIDQRMEAGGENLLAWWAEMFTLPVLAAQPAAPEELAALARLGADFVTPLPTIWESPERAAALGADYARELAAPEC